MVEEEVKIAQDARAAEIAAKVAALKAERAKKEAEDQAAKDDADPDLSKYGTHKGITCDGCAISPLQGFRYKCKNCVNHDLCESCYSQFQAGTMVQDNSMLRKNKVSAKIEDHTFSAYTDKDFQKIQSGGEAKPQAKAKKVKPNDPCPCNSGKKFKKCCDAVGGN
uniref:ZZ-type domain-containing protein n=1 Tax=Eutreptiella gymnastica TaxID=73025 RepID=A0A7S1HW37_9EUGL